VAREGAWWTGQRVREVSTSLMSSSSLPCNHCRRLGPARAERKVRGEPDGSRLRTGAAEEETEVAGEEGRKYVGV
jgi:hypothetical protein